MTNAAAYMLYGTQKERLLTFPCLIVNLTLTVLPLRVVTARRKYFILVVAVVYRRSFAPFYGLF